MIQNYFYLAWPSTCCCGSSLSYWLGDALAKHFAAIEGLRAWLVWAVVADHIAYWSGFRGPIGNFLRELGMPAVIVFMITSGFVITHLLIERPEPYRHYLLRRFMRLYPVFIVVCFLGYFTYPLPISVPGFDPEFGAEISKIVAHTNDHLWEQIVTHALMLNGLFNQATLPSADVAFCMVAWTITLEWQFYIIAPLVVTAVRRWAVTALALAILLLVTRHLAINGWFGSYGQPTLLPVMAPYIAVGIASRLLCPHLVGRISLPLAASAVLVFYMIAHQRELVVWALVYAGLLVKPPRLYSLLLAHPLASYLGLRSYAAFLSHFLTLNFSVWLWGWWFGVAPSVLPLALMAIPSTVIVSELLYRYVEKPGIRLGASWCRQQKGGEEVVVPFRRRAF